MSEMVNNESHYTPHEQIIVDAVRRYTAGQIFIEHKKFPRLPGIRLESPVFLLEPPAKLESTTPAWISFEYRRMQSLIPEDLPSHQRFDVRLGGIGQRATQFATYGVRKADPDSPFAGGWDATGLTVWSVPERLEPAITTPEFFEAAIARFKEQYPARKEGRIL